jgi:uncharacterized protein (DUF1697 family)
MARHVALLRGINLGSSRRVQMGRLREALSDRGYEDVRTFLQSGNVLLTSSRSPQRLARDLEGAIADDLGVDVDVVVRSRDELADVVERDPLGTVATDAKRYQVTFLARKAPASVARELGAGDFAPEQVVVSGREIYAWHPDGVQRSKLARLLSDRRLGGTARNWNTVTRLLALADEDQSS